MTLSMERETFSARQCVIYRRAHTSFQSGPSIHSCAWGRDHVGPAQHFAHLSFVSHMIFVGHVTVFGACHLSLDTFPCMNFDKCLGKDGGTEEDLTGREAPFMHKIARKAHCTMRRTEKMDV